MTGIEPDRAAVEAWKTLARARSAEANLLYNLVGRFVAAVDAADDETLVELAPQGRHALDAIKAQRREDYIQLTSAELDADLEELLGDEREL